jgi:hypothetical protein
MCKNTREIKVCSLVRSNKSIILSVHKVVQCKHTTFPRRYHGFFVNLSCKAKKPRIFARSLLIFPARSGARPFTQRAVITQAKITDRRPQGITAASPKNFTRTFAALKTQKAGFRLPYPLLNGRDRLCRREHAVPEAA